MPEKPDGLERPTRSLNNCFSTQDAADLLTRVDLISRRLHRLEESLDLLDRMSQEAIMAARAGLAVPPNLFSVERAREAANENARAQLLRRV